MRKMFVRIVLILLGILSIAGPVLACNPNPPSNPKPSYKDCEDLGSGYQFGFRVRDARNGTYRLTWNDGKLTGGAPQDPDNYVKIYNSNYREFDWKASLGIDAVIINAGGKSTIKKLDEKTEGKDYYGATNYYRKPYEIDEIYFCYDYELDVDTSAKGTFTNEAAWEITKTVDVAEQVLFAGETADFNYTVDVKNTAGGPSGFFVATEVKIKNNTPLSAKIKSIKDVLEPWDKQIKLDCDVRFPYTLKPGRTLTCTATTEVSSKRDGENRVWVSTYGYVDGDYAEADIEWSGEGSGTTASTVTVTDTNAAFGGPYTVNDDQTWNYTVSLDCPSDPAAYTDGVKVVTLDNTAAITETGQSASQSVAVTCYAPVVSTASQATYVATYNWDITKTSPISTIKIPVNETATVDYNVVVSVASVVESNLEVTGTVTVTNPHPSFDMWVRVADEVAPGVFAEVTDCSNPMPVAAGSTVTCNYIASLPTKPEAATTASVDFQGITFTSQAAMETTKIDEIDECVTVYDSAFAEPMGELCASEAPKAYDYNVVIGPFADCWDTDYTNTAWFETNDTLASDYANWQVLVNVDCGIAENCTLTREYWIAFSDPAGSGYLTTWNEVGGPSAPFFGTGSTWIQIMTVDAGESPYLKLAQQYAVGKLNVLYGAEPTPSLPDTLAQAEALLVQYETAQDTVADSPDAGTFAYTTGLLHDFNLGLTGPGVCPQCSLED